MTYQTIIFQKLGNIGVITLNRPSVLNAVDSLMSGELIDALEKVDGDDDLRAVVVAGAGNRAFSVGIDMKELVEAADGIEHIPTLLEIRRRIWRQNPWERLAALSKSTIAAVSGLVLGGGLELALACDVRLASDDAKFGFPEVRLGILPGRGGTQRLPRIVGRAKALEMILTGETIDAAEALRAGLVSKIVPAPKLFTTAVELGTTVANNAPLAVRFAREAVSKGLDMTLDQGLRMETDLYVLLQTTDDRSEGIRSFVEKRKPRFRGS